MSTPRLSMQDENGNTRVVGANGRDDLSNYAEDALKEVLGWYGLREGAEGQLPQPPPPPPPSSSSSLSSSPPAVATASLHVSVSGKNHVTSTASLPMVKKTHAMTTSSEESLQNGSSNNRMAVKTDSTDGTSSSGATSAHSGAKTDNPIDLTNGHTTSADMTNTNGNAASKTGSGSGTHRKLIGMRFLFPPLSDDMPLMERAKIWVRRHDYKYFVGWTEEELKTVDPILRPISTITPELYKLHMNRSEYCRNVKLKYCLEADTDWAQEFREKIMKPASEGGFTGLCQAKIAAAELWRKYSEKYRSHQARYPNPKSRYKAKKQNSSCNGGSDNDPNSKRKTSAEEEIEDDCMDDSQDAKRVRFDEEIDIEDEDDNMDPNRVNYESDECHEIDDVEYSQKASKDTNGQTSERLVTTIADKQTSHVPSESSPREPEEKHAQATEEKVAQVTDSSSHQSHVMSAAGSTDSLTNRAFFPRLTTAPFFGVPFSLYPGGVTHFAGVSAQNEYPTDGALNSYKYSCSTAPEVPPSPTMSSTAGGFPKPRQSDRHHEYKRSERGLSYLFPSLSDHNLSLIDKVRITVIRHKNNYFLGKSEEELSKMDPLIRPKMVVTPEIYKEYCHRNAMKYDSNLQFAMESPEPWAEEFRAKLMRPPSEGGFSSLCEVKLEAGRLWREFSGKYRMHNIVKWQMDLNSSTKGIKSDPDEVTEQQKTASGRSNIQLEPASPSETSDHDPTAMQSSYRMPSPQSSVESMDVQPVGTRFSGNSDAVGPSRADSDVFLHRTGLYEPASNSGALDLHVEPNSVRTAPAKLDRSPESQPESSQGLSPKRYLRSPKHGLRYPGCKDPVTPENYLMLAYQVGQPPPSMCPRDDPTDSSGAAEVSRTQGFSDMNSADALFKHLPKSMSVAQQLSIWLERYRHNFFLGYKKEDLAGLGEYLRPNMVVTKEVFNKYVPESMVDVISKIELIMLSSEPWAIEFQEKIHKSPKDGGFKKFEDAITDAVILWNLAKASYRSHQSWYDNRAKLQPSARPPSETPLDLHSSASRSIKTELESLSGSCQVDQHETNHRRGSEPATPANVALKQEFAPGMQDIRPAQVRGQHPMKNHGNPEQDGPHLRAATAVARDPESARFDGQASLSLLGLLWAVRDRLHQECADDPHTSWADRLHSHLPMLKAVLGPSYSLPNTTASCIVDLVLCTLHQHIQHIASLAPPAGETVCKRQDVVSQATS